MRTVTEITNNPGLKYTFIGKDSTGVAFYNEEVNIEYLEKRKKMQDIIDGKDKKNINKKINYQVPEAIEENTFYKTGDKFKINVDQRNRTINLLNERTSELKTIKTKYFPIKVRVHNEILFYDDYIDEVTEYETISYNLNTESVIGKKISGHVTNGDTGLGVPSLDIRIGIIQPEPLIISQDLASKTFILNVYGEQLETQFTFFPILSSSLSLNNFTPLRNNFINFLDKKPALVKYDDDIFLRTVNKGKILNLKDTFIDSTVPPVNDTSINISRNYDLSNSPWGTQYSEGYVMDTRISSISLNDTSKNWELRVGKGGQIYSLITDDLGETVPPQKTNNDVAPWIDEVWQTIAVDQSANPSAFNHSAGIYLFDPTLNEPYYTPRLATQIDEDDKSFYSINWSQPSNGNSSYQLDRKSYVLNLTKYKDLGDGVIEVTLGHYNFGPDTYDWHNMPWGGVRRTSMEHGFYTQTDQQTYDRLVDYFPDLRKTEDTGGWFVFSSDENGDGHSMGWVYGLDDPLPDSYDLNGNGKTDFLRMGYTPPLTLDPNTPETDFRNFLVATCVRRYRLYTRRGMWVRCYLVFGDDRDDVRQKTLNRDLVNQTTFEEMDNPESESSLIGYKLSLNDGSFTIEKSDSPDFYLYEQLINKGMPLFEVVMNDGTKFVTWDPYTSGTTKMYSGAVQVINLLGFCLTTDDATGPYTYDTLDNIFSDYSSYYDGNGQSLSTRLTFTYNFIIS